MVKRFVSVPDFGRFSISGLKTCYPTPRIGAIIRAGADPTLLIVAETMLLALFTGPAFRKPRATLLPKPTADPRTLVVAVPLSVMIVPVLTKAPSIGADVITPIARDPDDVTDPPNVKFPLSSD
jgi:hypothetical protein